MECYLDNSATTRPQESVVRAMSECMLAGYYNPSALYAPAVQVEKKLTACRELIAKQLHADAKRVIFTSGGTEADNLAILSLLSDRRGGRVLFTVGEHPAAADTLGIDVYKVRYCCVLLSGMLAGFGGASMTIAIIAQFTQTAISGHGFIAMAAVIFGKWTPFGAYGACLLFGFTQALVIMLGGGDFVVPSQILSMLPYAMTIIVLILFVGRSVAPKADGVPYVKGSR